MRRCILVLAGLLLVSAGSALAAETSDGHVNVNFWKTINFTIMVVVVVWALKKYAGGFFRKRTDEIQQGIVEAKQLREDAEARAADMERRMANLDAEIADLRASGMEEMAAEEARLKAAAEQAMARMRSNAEQEIQSASKHARKELRAYSAELALKIARRKVKETMTPEISANLVDAFAEDLGRVPRRVK